jgi:hypothetical protein
MQKTTPLQNAKASTAHDDITVFSSTLNVLESENNEKLHLK